MRSTARAADVVVPTFTQTSWHTCNDMSSTELVCLRDGVYSRIVMDLDFKLSTPGDILFEQQWSVMPKRNQDGTGQVLNSLVKCPDTCVSMINNRTTITLRAYRPRIAYPLIEVPAFASQYIPYGLWFSATDSTSTSSNVSQWLADPSVLTPQPSCTGYSAQLSNGDSCYPQDLPKLTNVVIDYPQTCGENYDYTHVNQSTFFSYPLQSCKAAVCNHCGTTPKTTVMRAFPFGVQCRIFQIAAPLYFLDISIVTRSGLGVVEPVYTSVEIAGDGMRLSKTGYSRAAISNIQFQNGYTPLVPSTAEGGYIGVCSRNVQDLAALDQGFLNPWVNYPNKGAGGVPTTTYLGGELMWFYLTPNEGMRLLGYDCAQAGGLGPVTNIYDNVNETQAGCASGAIQTGACVPGYVNDTFTPCQIASSLNGFTTLYDITTNVAQRELLTARFTPPGWNATAPNMWFHSKDAGGNFLMQQMRNLVQPIPLKMTVLYDISHDILVPGGDAGGVLLDTFRSQCVYSGASKAGLQTIRVCNTGADSIRVLIEVTDCQHIRGSTSAANSSLHYSTTVRLGNGYTRTNPNNCVETAPVEFFFDSQYFPIEPNGTQIPTFVGTCKVNVWNENRTIHFVDSDPIFCYYLPFKPLYQYPEPQRFACPFGNPNCAGIWILIGAGIFVAIVVLVIIVIVVEQKKHHRTASANDMMLVQNRNTYEDTTSDKKPVPMMEPM